MPVPRGPLSRGVLDCLAGAGGALTDTATVLEAADPLGDDLQLALYACYELHYSSFAGVDPRWEWDPHLLELRARLERRFDDEVRELAGPPSEVPPGGVGRLIFELAEADRAPSLSSYLEASGTSEQFREFMIHRSAYQLKEADPHTWAIPRLEGAAKAAMVEIQADEYGAGAAERMHSRLYAEAMAAVGLDDGVGAYLDRIPGTTLATVNLISMFGLHRRRRGALVGHLAMFEVSSAVPNRRYAKALRRLGFGRRATEFYEEHVEADSVHENIAAYDLAQGLALAEPGLTADIVLGSRALLALEGIAAARMLGSWERGESSLLPEPTATLVPA